MERQARQARQVRRGAAWFGLERLGMVWHGVVWHGVAIETPDRN